MLGGINTFRSSQIYGKIPQKQINTIQYFHSCAPFPFSSVLCLKYSSGIQNKVAIADESGQVCINESRWQCHDNAIFDLVWSDNDRVLGTAGIISTKSRWRHVVQDVGHRNKNVYTYISWS